ncbi:peroxiredoxin [Candidatus Binatia bacterium]|jgi:peroxiredoxin Q/BCP|nr:peroxiredoxin [Candidatus Binatia bacterium]
MIREGERAPDFTAPTADGGTLSLSDFRGKKPLILYFYPRDNTPGCTKEACSFRDHAGEIADAGAAIVGVSMDSQDAHRKFIADFRLNFPLLSDRDATICKAYGVARLGGWFPPKRVTFVIDRDGVVRRVIQSEFGIAKHIDEALETLRGLPA